jgi:nucleoside-diphosphate-sugar epimerase
MAELARRVRDELAPGAQIQQNRSPQPGQTVDRYVPDVTLAASELKLEAWIGLEDAVSRTASWARGAAATTEFHRTPATKS